MISCAINTLNNKMLNIRDQDIAVWYLNDSEISDQKLLDYYFSLLDEQEKIKHEKLIIIEKKHQYLITRAVTRIILGAYLKIQPQALEFSVTEHGKPYISNLNLKDQLFFNISHTKNLIVWAISKKIELGIDVEYKLKPVNYLKIAKALFGTEQIAILNQLKNLDLRDKFFEFWTKKEALIKGKNLFLLSKDVDLEAVNYKLWDLKISDLHQITLVANINQVSSKTNVIIKSVLDMIKNT
ncbi:MAG: 4'-phosphopantetheinyl transferase family protein [Gammaproteobacteria bacterium]